MIIIVHTVIDTRIIIITIHGGCGRYHWGLRNNCFLHRMGLHIEGGKGFKKCTEGGKGLCNIHSKNSKIHRLTTIMVMMCITVDNRWICYTEGYRVRSTGGG